MIHFPKMKHKKWKGRVHPGCWEGRGPTLTPNATPSTNQLTPPHPKYQINDINNSQMKMPENFILKF